MKFIINFFLSLTIRFFCCGFFDNRFYLILLVVILMHVKYTTYSSMWLSSLVNVPGTILHEFMHYFVGMILNARPCNFTIFPVAAKTEIMSWAAWGFAT